MILRQESTQIHIAHAEKNEKENQYQIKQEDICSVIMPTVEQRSPREIEKEANQYGHHNRLCVNRMKQETCFTTHEIM